MSLLRDPFMDLFESEDDIPKWKKDEVKRHKKSSPFAAMYDDTAISALEKDSFNIDDVFDRVVKRKKKLKKEKKKSEFEKFVDALTIE